MANLSGTRRGSLMELDRRTEPGGNVKGGEKVYQQGGARLYH